MNRYIQHRYKAVLIQMLCILVLNWVMWSSPGATEKFDTPAILTGKNLIQEKALEAAVASYYYGEQNKNWRNTYAYRRNEFQDLVPFLRYKKQMQESFAGIDLIYVEVESVPKKSRRDGVSYVEIVIRFVEVITDEVKAPRWCRSDRCKNGTTFSVSESTVWLEQGGHWKCLECGIRMHIPLNGRMLYSE